MRTKGIITTNPHAYRDGYIKFQENPTFLKQEPIKEKLFTQKNHNLILVISRVKLESWNKTNKNPEKETYPEVVSCCLILSPEVPSDEFHLIVFSNYPLLSKKKQWNPKDNKKPKEPQEKNSVRKWVFEQQTKSAKISKKWKSVGFVWLICQKGLIGLINQSVFFFFGWCWIKGDDLYKRYENWSEVLLDTLWVLLGSKAPS